MEFSVERMAKLLDHAERELFEYIEMFYNNQRLHAYLDYAALFEQLSLQKAA